jgi:GNAT superfamily N-acetyltransferase
MAVLPEIRISRWTEDYLPLGLSLLEKSAREEGYSFLTRLQDEWSSAAIRFAAPGECLFIAEIESGLVGIGGISRDPYQLEPDVGRLRHVYVDRPFRSRGVATLLVSACLACTGTKFRVIRLSTSALNPTAGRLYEQLGFRTIAADGERATHLLSTDMVHISDRDTP